MIIWKFIAMPSFRLSVSSCSNFVNLLGLICIFNVLLSFSMAWLLSKIQTVVIIAQLQEHPKVFHYIILFAACFNYVTKFKIFWDWYTFLIFILQQYAICRIRNVVSQLSFIYTDIQKISRTVVKVSNNCWKLIIVFSYDMRF